MERDIRKTNRIPGSCEIFTRPEDIGELNKYLRALREENEDRLTLDQPVDKLLSSEPRMSNPDSLSDFIDMLNVGTHPNTSLVSERLDLGLGRESISLPTSSTPIPTSPSTVKEAILNPNNKEDIEELPKNLSRLINGDTDSPKLVKDIVDLPGKQTRTELNDKKVKLKGVTYLEKIKKGKADSIPGKTKKKIELPNDSYDIPGDVKEPKLRKSVVELGKKPKSVKELSKYVDKLDDNSSELKLKKEIIELDNAKTPIELENRKEKLEAEEITSLSGFIDSLTVSEDIELSRHRSDIEDDTKLSLGNTKERVKGNHPELSLRKSKELIEGYHKRPQLEIEKERIRREKEVEALSKYIESLEIKPQTPSLSEHKEVLRDDTELSLSTDLSNIPGEPDLTPALSDFIDKITGNRKDNSLSTYREDIVGELPTTNLSDHQEKISDNTNPESDEGNVALSDYKDTIFLDPELPQNNPKLVDYKEDIVDDTVLELEDEVCRITPTPSESVELEDQVEKVLGANEEVSLSTFRDDITDTNPVTSLSTYREDIKSNADLSLETESEKLASDQNELSDIYKDGLYNAHLVVPDSEVDGVPVSIEELENFLREEYSTTQSEEIKQRLNEIGDFKVLEGLETEVKSIDTDVYYTNLIERVSKLNSKIGARLGSLLSSYLSSPKDLSKKKAEEFEKQLFQILFPLLRHTEDIVGNTPETTLSDHIEKRPDEVKKPNTDSGPGEGFSHLDNVEEYRDQGTVGKYTRPNEENDPTNGGVLEDRYHNIQIHAIKPSQLTRDFGTDKLNPRSYLRFMAEQTLGAMDVLQSDGKTRGKRSKNSYLPRTNGQHLISQARKLLLDEALSVLFVMRDRMERKLDLHRYRLPGGTKEIHKQLGKLAKKFLKVDLFAHTQGSVDMRKPQNRPESLGIDEKGNRIRRFGKNYAQPDSPTLLNGRDNHTLSNNFPKTTFYDRYLSSPAMKVTLEELIGDTAEGATLEEFKTMMRNSPYMTTVDNYIANDMDANMSITVDSNYYWEIQFEPYVSKFNGFVSYLPSFNEINYKNERDFHVKTYYGAWLPITNFELTKTKLVNKSLPLFEGEIVYPVTVEYTNEFRMSIADDQYKSMRRYFEQCSKVSVYNSNAHSKATYINRNGRGSMNNDSSKNLTVVDTSSRITSPYKNITFLCKIFCMTPQRETVDKYNLLLVLRDFVEERTGDSSPSEVDLNVSFSIVGEITSDKDSITQNKPATYDLTERRDVNKPENITKLGQVRNMAKKSISLIKI